MAFHGDRINMTPGLFVIPLLIPRPPNLLFSADPAGERTIDVKAGHLTAGIDMAQFRRIGRNSRGMVFLLHGVKPGDAFRFPECLTTGVTAGV